MTSYLFQFSFCNDDNVLVVYVNFEAIGSRSNLLPQGALVQISDSLQDSVWDWNQC